MLAGAHGRLFGELVGIARYPRGRNIEQFCGVFRGNGTTVEETALCGGARNFFGKKQKLSEVRVGENDAAVVYKDAATTDGSAPGGPRGGGGGGARLRGGVDKDIWVLVGFRASEVAGHKGRNMTINEKLLLTLEEVMQLTGTHAALRRSRW